MSKLRVAFYKAKYGAMDDKIIDFVTGGKGYSHCEIMLDRTTMIGAHFHIRKVEEFKYADVIDSPRWDVYEFDLPDGKAIAHAKEMIGSKYDTLGVLMYAAKLDFADSKEGVWCSELVQQCINIAIEEAKSTEMEKQPTLVMPNEQVDMLNAFGRLVTSGLKGKKKI